MNYNRGGQQVDRELSDASSCSDEEGRNVDRLLLHHPLVHFYVLYIAALFVALFWDNRRRAAVQNRRHSVSAERPLQIRK
jgi:hypothetical protein